MPNVTTCSRALAALHSEGLLKNPACKEPVVLFIRQATEPQEQRHWHATAHFRSTAAAVHLRGRHFRSQAAYHRTCKEELSHEHVVPNIVLYRRILDEPIITHAWLESLLRYFGIRATITREENSRLLRDSMPSGFWQVGHPLFRDPFARYKEAGLYESLEPLPGRSWFVSAA